MSNGACTSVACRQNSYLAAGCHGDGFTFGPSSLDLEHSLSSQQCTANCGAAGGIGSPRLAASRHPCSKSVSSGRAAAASMHHIEFVIPDFSTGMQATQQAALQALEQQQASQEDRDIQEGGPAPIRLSLRKPLVPPACRPRSSRHWRPWSTRTPSKAVRCTSGSAAAMATASSPSRYHRWRLQARPRTACTVLLCSPFRLLRGAQQTLNF